MKRYWLFMERGKVFLSGKGVLVTVQLLCSCGVKEKGQDGESWPLRHKH